MNLYQAKGGVTMYAQLSIITIGPEMRSTAEKIGDQSFAVLRTLKGFKNTTFFGDVTAGEYGSLSVKGVAPKGTTMGDIYRSVIPFLFLNLIVMGVMMAWPQLTLWLPGLMR